MACKIRKLRTFSLLLAAFVFNAHMVIPHDHHALDPDICQNRGSRGQHPGFPYHCHSFNDFTSEKATNYVTIKSFQVRDYEKVSHTNICYQPVLLAKYYNDFRLAVNSCIKEYSFLRAPPSFV